MSGARSPTTEGDARRGFRLALLPGAPGWEVEGRVIAYVAMATGESDAVSDTARELTHHAPMSLTELLDSNPESRTRLLAAR